MGNSPSTPSCCFVLPSPFRRTSETRNAFFQVNGAAAALAAATNGTNLTIDWLVLDHNHHLSTNHTASSVSSSHHHHHHHQQDHVDRRDGLTIILTLQENSNIEKTTRWIQAHQDAIKNVLVSTPRPIGNHNNTAAMEQPAWASPAMTRLWHAIGSLSRLEVFLLHEIGTTNNPVAVASLAQHVLATPHTHLKQAYLVGHFVGSEEDCVALGDALKRQPALKAFAMYGNASAEFRLDPILQAVTQLPTLKELQFHANMPHSLSSTTVEQVGSRISHQLTSLTIHSCDTNGYNVERLAQALESSTSLKELTVFEAFEVFQRQSTRPALFNHIHDTTEDHDDGDNNNSKDSKPEGSCALALASLIRKTQSLERLYIWFGFCANSQVLVPFAQALAANTTISHFETALLWTDYDHETAHVFVDTLRHSNYQLQSFPLLIAYKGPWRLALYFFIRLNQLGRQKLVRSCHDNVMTPNEWIQVLTTIPTLVDEDNNDNNNNDVPTTKTKKATSSAAAVKAALEDAPANDPDWFATSWIYYYLRLDPSLCYCHQ